MSKQEFEEINILAFTSVLFAAILLGFLAHELIHLILISDVSSITLYFGAQENLISVCCLTGSEQAYEELAYAVQAIVTVGWIIINSGVFRQNE